MKHPKQNKRAPPTHPSALAVPSYHRILVKHGLIEKTLSIPDAYEVFLKAGADPEVQKLRRKVERGNKMKHVPALYLATAMALQGMTKQELDALKLRIEALGSFRPLRGVRSFAHSLKNLGVLFLVFLHQ